MTFSAKTDYACLAMLELALRYAGREPVRLRDLADAHQIPSPFLVQILLQLKSAGLVESTRGAAGGYRLARTPQEISLADILEVMEGPASGSNSERSTPASKALAETWRALRANQREWLAQISLADLAEQVRGPAERMYYI